MKEIGLTQGKVALVDDLLCAYLLQFPWYAFKNGHHWYALCKFKENGRWRNLYMHRVILGVGEGVHVDHWDGNGLNNTRLNLRVATKSQNNWNSNKRQNSTSSQYKGVHWDRSSGKWLAQIRQYSERMYLGAFEIEGDAAMAYNRAAIERFGEFARLNLVEER